MKVLFRRIGGRIIPMFKKSAQGISDVSLRRSAKLRNELKAVASSTTSVAEKKIKSIGNTRKFLSDWHKISKDTYTQLGRQVGKGYDVAFANLTKNLISSNRANIHIAWLQAEPVGLGNGSRTLKSITEIADKHNVKLDLVTGAANRRTSPVGRLKRFYKRHGFTAEKGSNYMVRDPALVAKKLKKLRKK